MSVPEPSSSLPDPSEALPIEVASTANPITAPSSPRDALPTEVLFNILQLLDNADVLSCMSLSRHLHDLSASILYKELVVDVHRRNPFWTISKLAQRKMKLRQIPKPSDFIASPTLFLNPLHNRFSHTTHLTIETHPDCFHLPPIHMPNLHTLRIRPQPGAAACVELCWGPRPWPAKPHTCAIVQHLRPRRVILGSADTGLCGTAAGLWRADQPFPPPFVKDIVFHVGSDPNFDERTFLSDLPGSLERFTMVIEPKAGAKKWDREFTYGPKQFSKEFVAAFFDQLAIPCAGNAKLVEIVGMEKMDKRWFGEKGEKEVAMDRAKGAVRDRLMTLCATGEVDMDQEELAEKVEGIVFMTRKEWKMRESRENGRVYW